ncbi:MAG: hypothetical protein EYC70_16700 [Planctomycetota bacterium]|nr:MAG: hypothetical protein EYC70_16700 [Planctomycetota bacterium]
MSVPLPPEGRARAGRLLAYAVAGYLALTALYFWPMFAQPAAHFSVGRDYFQNTWNLWWTRYAWETDRPFLSCDVLFHPTGTSLAFHTITYANTLPGLALQDFLGLTATHTVLFLSAFVTSALGAWALAYHVTRSAWGAFLAGVVYSFNAYHTPMITQLNNAHFEWIPLFLLSLLLIYEHGRWWHVFWAALTLALAGYVDWYQPVFCAMAGAVVLLALLWRDRRWADGRLWLQLALAGAGALLLVLPGAVPLLREMRSVGAEGLEVPIRYVGEMQLLGTRPQGSPFYHFWTVGFGYALCLLVAWTLWRARDRAQRPWWWLFGLSFLLLQGPYLVVLNRHLESVPLPMALFPHLPVLNLIRVPHRFLVLVFLSLGVLGAFGLRELQRRLQRRGTAWSTAAAALACAAVALEMQPARHEPVELRPASVYADLAQDARPLAVLELPLDFRDGYSMYLQTQHEKPLTGGYISHIMPAALRALQSPLMRALLPSTTDNDMEFLPQFQAVDVDALDAATLEAWRQELLEDQRIGVIVFHHGPDFPVPQRALPDPEQLTLAAKLRIALAPYRFNSSIRDFDVWRQLAAANLVTTLAQRSGQARAILVRLFGPPSRTEGHAEIWDLRPTR